MEAVDTTLGRSWWLGVATRKRSARLQEAKKRVPRLLPMAPVAQL